MSDRSSIMFNMNRLSTERRAAILGLMVEGNSLRATTRMAGCSINTVSKLLLDVGKACAAYQDEHLRDLPADDRGGRDLVIRRHTRRKHARGAKRHVRLPATSGRGRHSTPTQAHRLLVRGRPQYEDAAAFMIDLKDRLRAGFNSRPTGTCLPEQSAWRSARHRLRAAHQALRTHEPEGPLQPAGLHRDARPSATKANRTPRDQHELRGAPEPHDADGHAPVHAADQRVLEEARQPHGRHRAALYALQLRAATQDLGNPYPRTPAMAAGVAEHIWSLREIAALLD